CRRGRRRRERGPRAGPPAGGGIVSATYPDTWRRPPQMIRTPFWRRVFVIGAVAYLAFALGTIDVNWARVAEGLERGQRFISGFLSPDFTTRWRDISAGLVESLTM